LECKRLLVEAVFRIEGNTRVALRRGIGVEVSVGKNARFSGSNVLESNNG
jgi:hypothetical protein